MATEAQYDAILQAVSPGERATVAMLALILAELQAMRETQEHMAEMFSAVSCGGTAIATVQS